MTGIYIDKGSASRLPQHWKSYLPMRSGCRSIGKSKLDQNEHIASDVSSYRAYYDRLSEYCDHLLNPPNAQALSNSTQNHSKMQFLPVRSQYNAWFSTLHNYKGPKCSPMRRQPSVCFSPIRNRFSTRYSPVRRHLDTRFVPTQQMPLNTSFSSSAVSSQPTRADADAKWSQTDLLVSTIVSPPYSPGNRSTNGPYCRLSCLEESSDVLQVKGDENRLADRPCPTRRHWPASELIDSFRHASIHGDVKVSKVGCSRGISQRVIPSQPGAEGSHNRIQTREQWSQIASFSNSKTGQWTTEKPQDRKNSGNSKLRGARCVKIERQLNEARRKYVHDGSGSGGFNLRTAQPVRTSTQPQMKVLVPYEPMYRSASRDGVKYYTSPTHLNRSKNCDGSEQQLSNRNCERFGGTNKEKSVSLKMDNGQARSYGRRRCVHSQGLCAAIGGRKRDDGRAGSGAIIVATTSPLKTARPTGSSAARRRRRRCQSAVPSRRISRPVISTSTSLGTPAKVKTRLRSTSSSRAALDSKMIGSKSSQTKVRRPHSAGSPRNIKTKASPSITAPKILKTSEKKMLSTHLNLNDRRRAAQKVAFAEDGKSSIVVTWNSNYFDTRKNDAPKEKHDKSAMMFQRDEEQPLRSHDWEQQGRPSTCNQVIKPSKSEALVSGPWKKLEDARQKLRALLGVEDQLPQSTTMTPVTMMTINDDYKSDQYKHHLPSDPFTRDFLDEEEGDEGGLFPPQANSTRLDFDDSHAGSHRVEGSFLKYFPTNSRENPRQDETAKPDDAATKPKRSCHDLKSSPLKSHSARKHQPPYLWSRVAQPKARLLNDALNVEITKQGNSNHTDEAGGSSQAKYLSQAKGAKYHKTKVQDTGHFSSEVKKASSEIGMAEKTPAGGNSHEDKFDRCIKDSASCGKKLNVDKGTVKIVSIGQLEAPKKKRRKLRRTTKKKRTASTQQGEGSGEAETIAGQKGSSDGGARGGTGNRFRPKTYHQLGLAPLVRSPSSENTFHFAVELTSPRAGNKTKKRRRGRRIKRVSKYSNVL